MGRAGLNAGRSGTQADGRGAGRSGRMTGSGQVSSNASCPVVTDRGRSKEPCRKVSGWECGPGSCQYAGCGRVGFMGRGSGGSTCRGLDPLPASWPVAGGAGGRARAGEGWGRLGAAGAGRCRASADGGGGNGGGPAAGPDGGDRPVETSDGKPVAPWGRGVASNQDRERTCSGGESGPRAGCAPGTAFIRGAAAYRGTIRLTSSACGAARRAGRGPDGCPGGTGRWSAGRSVGG